MATLLKKPLSREMPRRAAKRNWIVTLDPSAETVIVKEKGLRVSYEITIDAVYMAAARIAADRLVAERREKRRQPRQIRRGLLRGKDKNSHNVPGRSEKGKRAR